jgi:serine/threonine protein kinase
MSVPAPSIGQILGHYRIVEQIGAGGMGVVYRAHDEQLDRDVALKMLPAGTLADEATRTRFRKEALALAKLDHPNVATIHEFGSQNGVDFLVTAYVPGITLDTKIDSGALPEAEVISLGIQLAAGLAAAHEQGVIHGDLKPGNLRLTPDGRLKILDFGLARLIEPEGDDTLTATLTKSQGVTGTLPYMAPEQLRGQKADFRIDIWAAGAVLYEMATGERPFKEQTAPALAADIIHKAPPAPRSLKPDMSPGLEAIIRQCLEKEPEKPIAPMSLVPLIRMTKESATLHMFFMTAFKNLLNDKGLGMHFWPT